MPPTRAVGLRGEASRGERGDEARLGTKAARPFTAESRREDAEDAEIGREAGLHPPPESLPCSPLHVEACATIERMEVLASRAASRSTGVTCAAGTTIALSMVCVGIEVRLLDEIVSHGNGASIWAFVLVPSGGLPGFVVGYRELVGRQRSRALVSWQLVLGALAMGTPGLLGLLVLTDEPGWGAFGFFELLVLLILVAPLVGWGLLASGIQALLGAHGSRRARVKTLAGAAMLSLPWIACFGVCGYEILVSS
jgi:hypothetical protein